MQSPSKADDLAVTKRVESDEEATKRTASRIAKRRHIVVLSGDEDDSVSFRRFSNRRLTSDRSSEVVKVEEEETDAELVLELAEIELKKKMLQLEADVLVFKRRKMKLVKKKTRGAWAGGD